MAVESLVGYRAVCARCGATGPFEDSKLLAIIAARDAGWELCDPSQGDRCTSCRRDEPPEAGDR